MTFSVFEKQDVAMATKVEPLEEVIDTLNDEVKKKHHLIMKDILTVCVHLLMSRYATDFHLRMLSLSQVIL